MKKRFLFLICLISLFSIGITLAGCKEEHVHIFGDWQLESEATCLKATQYYRICGCGERETTQMGNKLPHTEGEWIVDRDSTCTATGTQHKKCTVCNTITQTETIKKKSHFITEWVQVSSADCEHAQVLERHCTTCTTQNETIEGDAALGHTESSWQSCLDGTHNETGYQEKICLTCSKRMAYAPKVYTITFNSNGGSSVSAISQEFDSLVIKPANPVKDDCMFMGWYLDNETFQNEFFTLSNGQSAKMPIGGACLYAKWENGSDTFVYNKITYRNLGNGEYEIVKGPLYDANIYSDAINYNVVSIADNAFYNWQSGTGYASRAPFVTYTVPKTVRRIGKNAFRNSLLQNIYFEKGSVLESIGDYAFSENLLSTYVLRLPETLKTIGDYAFSSDNSDNNYMYYAYLPSSVEVLGKDIFKGQKKLQRVICLSEKIKNTANYNDLCTKVLSVNSSWGEFTWVEDMLFFKANNESFARLLYFNASGLYTKDIDDYPVTGKYEIIKIPKFKYDYIIESFTFFAIEGIHGIIFTDDANVLEIKSYAFGQFRASAGTPLTFGDIISGNKSLSPNFLFSSNMDWKNIVLNQEWIYLHGATELFCVEIDGTSASKTTELLARLNDSLNINEDNNKFCVNVEASIYSNNQPNDEDYKFRVLLFGSLHLSEYL